MATKLKFGLLLPHFCEYASTEACIEGSKKAEAYGFDSVWVRDHLVFEPHGMEGEDNHHIEGLLVLAAICCSSGEFSGNGRRSASFALLALAAASAATASTSWLAR